MRRLTIRSALAHWRRFVLTTVAVVVGVCFVVGSFVLTDSLAASINHLLRDADTHIDFVVTGGGSRGGRVGGLGLGGGGGGRGGDGLGRAPLSADLVGQLGQVPGVAAVDPVVTGPAGLLDKAGQAKAFDIAAVANWPDHPDMSAVHLVSGRAPRGPGDVVIDTATAADRGLRLRSRVRIATARGVVTERVSGLAERGTGDLGIAGQIIDVTLPRATKLVGTDGQVGSLLIRVAPDANHDTVAAALSATVGPDHPVTSAAVLLADARARIQDRLKSFNGLMLGFAAITLFVSGFLIWNTFSTVVAQRSRELALLRAVGASREQVFASVIGEGALVGVVSSLVGIGTGVGVAVGLRAALGAFGFDLPAGGIVSAPRSIIVGVAIGLGVTIVSAVGPARRSTKVAPVAAMTDAAVSPALGTWRRPALGMALVAVGLAFGARGLAETSLAQTPRLESLGIGGALSFLGVAMLARYLAGPIIGAIGWPFGRAGGIGTRLARRNAVRDPRRTASTALALTVGMALVATTLVLGASVKTAFGGALRDSINAPVVVSADGISPIDAAVSRAIVRTPGVTTAVDIESVRIRTRASESGGFDGGRLDVSTGSVPAIRGVVRPGFRSGGYPTNNSTIAISASTADERHLVVGDILAVGAGDGGAGDVVAGPGPDQSTTPDPPTRDLRITGVYERDELLGDAIARPGALSGLESDNQPITKLVLVTTNGDPAVLAHKLARVAAGIPNSAAQTADDYVTSQTNALDIVLGIVDVLLLFAVLVAALGIANTLALAVVERTRELGLLRAAGMDRRVVRRMIRSEGVLIALFGGVLGIGFGVGFAAAVAGALPVDTARLTLPIGRLVLLFAAAGLLGIIAAAVPARRAARLDVLEAVAAP